MNDRITNSRWLRFGQSSFVILTWNFSAGRINDEIGIAVLDPVENVWAALINLEHLGYFNFRSRQRLCGSAGGNDFETEFHKLTRDWDYRFLVGVFDADKNFSRFRQRRGRGHLRFRIRETEIDVHPHHFTGGFHLRTK